MFNYSVSMCAVNPHRVYFEISALNGFLKLKIKLKKDKIRTLIIYLFFVTASKNTRNRCLKITCIDGRFVVETVL